MVFIVVAVVVSKVICFRSDLNRTGVKGLSFCYPRSLCCLNQMITVMVQSQHRVSPLQAVKRRTFMKPDARGEHVVSGLFSGAPLAIW